jgi:hypothetical protein
MLGVTGAELGMAQSPQERANILSGARDYITGGSSFNLKSSQRRELGKLGSMVTGGGPDTEVRYSGNQGASYPQLGSNDEEGYKDGGKIPGKVNKNTGDDTVIKAKKGEYVVPADVVSYVGVEKLDKLVEGSKQKLGLKPKKQGYATGGVINDALLVGPSGLSRKKRNAALGQFDNSIITQAKYAHSPVGSGNSMFVIKDGEWLPVERTVSNSFDNLKGYAEGGYIDPERKDIIGTMQGSEGFSAFTRSGEKGVISPEAADKLARAWGLDKESPNWQPEYGVPVTSRSYGGSQTTQVIQPGPGGVMPGVQLTSDRSIPMGLPRSEFEARAAEEATFSKLPNAKEQAKYLADKETRGINRRKASMEEELLPYKKEELAARAISHRRGPKGKEKKEGALTDVQHEELKILDQREREARSRLAKLNKRLSGWKQIETDANTEIENIRKRRFAMGVGEAPAPFAPAPTGPTYEEFVKKVKAAGSKLPDDQLKAYYRQKYGGQR